MRLLGNIIWFLLGGFILFIVYTLAAIFFFPVFTPVFRIAKYSLWPFGQEVISEKQLQKYKELNGDSSENIVETASSLIGKVLNILWMLTFGWILALLHLIFSIVNLCLFFFIITIPNIGGHWKMIRIAFMPFNTVLVSSELAGEIRKELEKEKLKI